MISFSNRHKEDLEMAEFYSRHDAAAVLRKVAEDTENGMYPDEVTPFEFGQAVARALVNCPWADSPGFNLQANLGEFLRGVWHGRNEHGHQEVVMREVAGTKS